MRLEVKDIHGKVHHLEAEAALLDNDGTLVDSYAMILGVRQKFYHQVLTSLGLDLSFFTEEEWTTLSRRQIDERIFSFARTRKHKNIEDRVAAAGDGYRAECCALMNQGTAPIHLWPDAENLIRQIHATNTPMAVVTNAVPEWATAMQQQFAEQDIYRSMKTWVTVGDAPPKPAPGMLQLAMSRLAVDRAVMIGDGLVDMQAAQAAGIPGIWVARGTVSVDAFQHGEVYGVSSLAEVRVLES